MTSGSDETRRPFVLVLAGAQTIRQARSAWEMMRSALAANSDLELDLSDVSDVDLSFVQLVEATRRAASEAGGEMTLAGPAEGRLHDVLTRGGFLHPADADRAAFWLRQGATQ